MITAVKPYLSAHHNNCNELFFESLSKCDAFQNEVLLSFMFCQVGLHAIQAMVHDLFEHKDLGRYNCSFKAVVNPTGVVMVKLTPV